MDWTANQHHPCVLNRTMSRRVTSVQHEAFQLLSNQRRRYAVWACQELEPPIELGELAEQIAAWEHETTVEAVTAEQRRRVYTSLQQNHLPELENSGVIEFDRGEIEPREGVEELTFYLQAVPGDDIPWGQYYLGLSGIAALVTASAWTGVYPSGVPWVFWPAVITLVFALSAAAHVWWTKRNRFQLDGPPPDAADGEHT